MIRFAIALVVGGAFLTFLGYKENKLASAADAQPQAITATDLIANGPGENANVKVSGVYILNDYVSEYNEDDPDTYTKLWVPAISEDDPWIVKIQDLAAQAEALDPDNPDYSAIESLPYPTNIGMVIYSEDVNSAAAFDHFWEQTEVQGLIINEIETLSGEELNILKADYPGIDPSTVLVLEHNRKPKGTGSTMLMMVGGIVLILAGPGLFVVTRGK